MIAPSPRAAIHDKVRGTLSSITASLSALDANNSKGIGGMLTSIIIIQYVNQYYISGAGGASDGDLAARFQKLKQMGNKH